MNCDVQSQNQPGSLADYQSETEGSSSLWLEHETLRNIDVLLGNPSDVEGKKINGDDLKKKPAMGSSPPKDKAEMSLSAKDDPAFCNAPFDCKSRADDLPVLYRTDDRSVETTETGSLTLISGTSKSKGGSASISLSPKRQVDILCSPGKPQSRIQALRSKMGWLTRSRSQRSCTVDEDEDELSSIDSSQNSTDIEAEGPKQNNAAAGLAYAELSSDDEDFFSHGEDVRARDISIQDSLHLTRKKLVPMSLEMAFRKLDGHPQARRGSTSDFSDDAVHSGDTAESVNTPGTCYQLSFDQTDQDVAASTLMSRRTTTRSKRRPRRNRKRRTVIDDAPTQKDVDWEKPEWATSRSILKSSVKMTTRKPIEWERPSWTTESVLKPTGKAELLRTKGNLAKPITTPPGKGDGINKEAHPDQILRRKGCRIAEKTIEWEKPTWKTENPLKTTEKGKALKSGIDTVRPTTLEPIASFESEDKSVTNEEN